MNNSLNRKQAPPIGQVSQLALYPPDVVKLDNDVPVYIFNRGEQDVLKMQMYFSAGKMHEWQPTMAQMTASLMKEGTRELSAQDIAEQVEHYGASLKVVAGSDYAVLSLHLLTKHLGEVLPLVFDILANAALSEAEFEKKKSILKQQLAVKREKIDYLADRRFNAVAFGGEHPYGYSPLPEMYDKLQLGELRKFARENYAAGCSIYIAGKLAHDSVSLLNRWLGGARFSPEPRPPRFAENLYLPKAINEYIAKKDSMQAAVRVGCMSIKKSHPDYTLLKITGTILGGYFGSRLMGNIREDKAYTYGIYSMSVNFFHGDYFIISTEVGVELWESTLKEIFFEIDRLKNDLVGEGELMQHRNYMLGSLLQAVDGPFKTASAIRELLMYGLHFSYIKRYMQAVKSVTPQQIRATAQKYLPTEKDALQVVVGP